MNGTNTGCTGRSFHSRSSDDVNSSTRPAPSCRSIRSGAPSASRIEHAVLGRRLDADVAGEASPSAGRRPRAARDECCRRRRSTVLRSALICAVEREAFAGHRHGREPRRARSGREQRSAAVFNIILEQRAFAGAEQAHVGDDDEAVGRERLLAERGRRLDLGRERERRRASRAPTLTNNAPRPR